MRLKISVLLVALALLSFSSPASVGPIQVLEGYCELNSSLGEVSSGTNSRGDRPRFFCDSAVIAFFDEARRHAMIQFVGTRRNHGQIVAFSGLLDSEGTMNVSRIYLEPGRPIPVSDVVCRVFRRNEAIRSIVCSNQIGASPRGIVPTMAFTVTAGN